MKHRTGFVQFSDIISRLDCAHSAINTGPKDIYGYIYVFVFWYQPTDARCQGSLHGTGQYSQTKPTTTLGAP